MSDLIAEPAAAGQAPLAAPAPHAAPAATRTGPEQTQARSGRTRTSRMLPLVAAAVVAMAVGVAGTAFAVDKGRDDKPTEEYEVTLFLTKQASDQQKTDVRAALTSGYPGGQIKFFNRQQAYAEFVREYLGNAARAAQVDQLSEYFEVKVRAAGFECSKATAARQYPGVEEVIVNRYSRDDDLIRTASVCL